MYKATFTKSLKDLKRLHFGPLFLLTAFGGAGASFVGNKIGNEAMLYSLMLFLFFAVCWMLTGNLNVSHNKGELHLSENELRLKWMEEEEISILHEVVSPSYAVCSYRPLGFLPKKEYIQLFLEGGPIGPHEYFFFHDGEYNASQWEKLALRQHDAT